MNRERALALLHMVKAMAPAERRRVIRALPEPAFRAIEEEWRWQARGGQIEPSGDWRVWLIMAGRGFGKTRAGAEWVWARVREHARTRKGTVTGDCPQHPLRIALVGGTLEEVAKVMVEGESGLLACARSGEQARWVPSRGLFIFPSGAVAFAYSGERPGALRGPQHHFAWCDELAKWARPVETWDNLRLGLRLGDQPRAMVTTTPQPGPALKRIMALRRTEVTRGRTAENPDLAEDFREAVMETYGRTRLGRQELEGVLLDEAAGALWTRELIEKCRVDGDSDFPRGGAGISRAARESHCPLRRVVIGVDPPASAAGTCGIVACGLGEDGIAYVLGDHSIAGASPHGWAAKVAAAAEIWQADRVIAEKNNGGDMVADVLAGADAGLPVRLVSASRGKVARAEPIAGRFEAGKAKFAGCFPELEDELSAMTAGGDNRGAGSPDRADAMVWALTELFQPPRAEPRVRVL